MIGAIFDHAQKLFGKGFLVAAFVPTLLFAFVVAYILLGFDGVMGENGLVRQWARQETQEAGVQALVWLVMIYLLAYVLYGVRASLQQFYGGFPLWPLSLLSPAQLALQGMVMRRRADRLERCQEALDVPRWATLFEFRPTSSREFVAPDRARSMVAEIRSAHDIFLKGIKGRRPLAQRQIRTYERILGDARVAQSSADDFGDESPEGDEVRRDVDDLVGEIRAAYNRYPKLREAMTPLEQWALRDWRIAYAALTENYPDTEDWLRPTRLGNIFAMLETYCFKRYGINFGGLWPRLRLVLDEKTGSRIDDANVYLDFALLMSLLAAAAGAVAVVEAFADRARAWELSAAAAALFGGYLLFYGLALQASREFVTAVQAAIDLYRRKLLDAMDLEPPQTYEEEKALWNKLRRFVSQAELPDTSVRFKKPVKKPEKPERPDEGAATEDD